MDIFDPSRIINIHFRFHHFLLSSHPTTLTGIYAQGRPPPRAVFVLFSNLVVNYSANNRYHTVFCIFQGRRFDLMHWVPLLSSRIATATRQNRAKLTLLFATSRSMDPSCFLHERGKRNHCKQRLFVSRRLSPSKKMLDSVLINFAIRRTDFSYSFLTFHGHNRITK